MRYIPPANYWLLAWGAGYAAVGAAALLVPLYAITLGAGPFLVGLIAATAALAGVPGAVLWGRLAERTGRHRTFLLISLGLTTVSLVIMPLVPTVDFVLVANALLWFAVAAAAPVLTLLVVADTPEHEWDIRIGVLSKYQGYGWLLGLLAGAAWNVIGTTFVPAAAAQRVFFYALAAVTALAFLSGYRLFPGTTVSIREFGRSRRSIERLVRGSGRRVGLNPISPLRVFWSIRRLHPRKLVDAFPRTLLTYLFAIFVAFTGFAAFFGPLPAFLTTDAGLSTGDIFAVFLASSAASAVYYTRAGSLSSRRGPYVPQFVALGVRALLFALVGLAAILTTGRYGVLLVSFAAIGITWAVIAITAASIVTRLAPTNLRGDALGAYTALSGLATGIGSLLGGGIAARFGYLVTFFVAGGLVVIGLFLAYSLYRQPSQTTPGVTDEPV